MAVVSKVTLKTYFENGDAPTEAQFIDLIDSLMEVPKTYIIGTTYTNGTPQFTTNLGSAVLLGGELTPYQTADGQWWMRGSLQVDLVSSIAGVTGANVVLTGFEPVYAVSPVTMYYSFTPYFAPYSGDSSLEATFPSPATYDKVLATFEFPITGKPAWAD
jgi:hypothetical protein